MDTCAMNLTELIKLAAAHKRALEQRKAYKAKKRATDPEWVEKVRAERRDYMARKAAEAKEKFARENERRAAEGLPPLEPRKPGRPRKAPAQAQAQAQA